MKQTILLIEDNIDIRENTAELLELAGFNPISASNGNTALSLIREQVPDLILCDIQMPELNGYQLLDLIRNDGVLHEIPFIFLTAYSEASEIKKGLEMGASAYIIKPFEPDDLIAQIRFHLKE